MRIGRNEEFDKVHTLVVLFFPTLANIFSFITISGKKVGKST